jgi:hypothetical protein
VQKRRRAEREAESQGPADAAQQEDED